MQRFLVNVIAAVLIIAAMTLQIYLMVGKSVTGDELSHVAAGYSYLRTGEVVLNPMHPPLIKEICAIPLLFMDLDLPEKPEAIRYLGRDITYQWEFGKRLLTGPDRQEIVFRARIPAVLLSGALAGLTFLWARELWGPAGGLAALFLYVFDPTITAHSQFVTTDIGFGLFATLFVFLFRRHLLRPSRSTVVFAGIALGLALGSKFSAIALPGIAALLATAALWKDPAPERWTRAKWLVVDFLAMGGLAAVVLWGTYLFPSDLSFYQRGLSAVKGDYNPSYLHFLMGEFRQGGWPHYFLIAWLVKTPIPAILAVALGIALFVCRKCAGWLEEACIIIPGAALFVGYSLGADPIGIRYILPCYPFIFIFAGRVGPWLASLGRRGAALAGVLAIWQLSAWGIIAPDHLAYFNPIAGGPRGGLAWLDDSNVDWGQGLIQLQDYFHENPLEDYKMCMFADFEPEYFGITGESIWVGDLLKPPAPGTTLVLSAHCVARASAWLALHEDHGPENWFDRHEPKDVVGHAFYVYEIPPSTHQEALDENFAAPR